MFVRTILLSVIMISFVPNVLAYDPVQIKQFISDERELFQITQWHGSDETQRWHADSAIKWLTVEVDRNQIRVGSAYFNPPYREEAKARCVKIASLTLLDATPDKLAAIATAMKKATQFHKRQSIQFENLQFDAEPILKGAFVTMYCSVTTKDAS